MGAHNKRLEALLPAIILSAFSIGLFVVSFIANGSLRLGFLNWNLFLAWLPLFFAIGLKSTLSSNRWLSTRSLILTALWLVFLPNSFYIVTDFIHLATSTSDRLVYESVMIMSFALSGLLLGCMSVYIIHQELKKRVNNRRVYDLLGTSFLLSSLAIFFGRNLGYNSWDILANPFGILLDFFDRLLNPSIHGGMYTFTLLFFAYISIVYAAYYKVRQNSKVY